MNAITRKIIYLKDAHRKREIASLTKIMTCYVALLLADRYQLDINNLIFKVSWRA